MNKTYHGIRIKSAILFASIFMGIAWVPSSVYAQDTQNASQQKYVSGRVLDEKGEGVPNVSVTIKGTTRGTVTKTDGTFSIQAKQGETLNFSGVGYKTQSLVLGSETSVNITITTDASNLADVVVVGYGVQRKVTISGAVSAVKGDALVKSCLLYTSDAADE